MAKTRSKGNEGDKRSSTSVNSVNKKHTPISKGSKTKKKSSVSSSNTSPSPLRRSTRETPTKRNADLSPTPSSTKKKNSTTNSDSTANPSGKKTASMEKKKIVSGASRSGMETPKNKSKGKQKVQADGENTQTCKRNSKLVSNSSSPLSDKEEGSLTKRQRVLMHAKTYKDFFKPRRKTSDSRPVEISEAVEAPADEVVSAEVDTHARVDASVIEMSCLREYSSDSTANEASPYAAEANTTNKVSENDVKEPVVSVAENNAESSSNEMDCEILSVQNKGDDPPDAGSTGEVDPGVAAIPGDDALDISKEHQASEEDFVPNACLACREPGVLLCCEGKNCKRAYHPSCLDPPLQSCPPGAWLCISCIQKKIQSDVYAVFDGIECIWDAKDARTENGKLYLVKYKNLAHLHNRWIPEAEIAVQSPELLSKFNWRMQKEKNLPRWKQEWTEPQRLLMKRPLMPESVATEFYDGLGGSVSFCNTEWLVKWRDLGYEHATWELETAPFLCSEEGAALIKAFASRRQQARLSSFPQRVSRALEVKQSALDRLDKLPDSFPPGLDSEHLQSLNQLRHFWHKTQNAVFIDEQERVIKTILFIMTVIEDICRPILIVSSVGSLPLWESKFQRLAPSINVVSYAGSKPVRKLIRDVEFYEDSGCIMFQVLLSHPDAMVEDFEMLDSIGWEAVIIDECQSSRISKYLERFKNLSADFRLVLLSSPLKDNVPEYVNMLSYLDPNTCLKSSTLAHFKEKFGSHIAYERKDETSKVVEYWVPARFSKVQLELYCSTLLSNSFALRSSLKNDQVGALRNMLISLRKCCDHPYLVYPELQTALTKERPITEILNIGVYASGKLLLLDKLLYEMKLRGLRVVIVFQAGGGSGRNQIGEFLDDFLRQRFGQEAYEHVERGLLPSKKQLAMNNFNDKSKGRFVFLVENRACQPSLKLSAVDAVFIFDGDWNPMNDTRCLQKINIQPEQVPVFRFYSPCAVEEKVLSLARQDFFLDSTLQGVVPSVSHSLLSWGAEQLFSLLHQLHLQPDDAFNDYCSAYVSPEDMAFVDKVMNEIMDRVSGKSSGAGETSLLVEARPTGESYSRDSGPLIGENEGVSSLQGESLVFWSALLEGKSPQWRFIQSDGPSQRIRTKVRPFDNSDKPLVAEPSGTEEPSKKKKKNGGDASMGGIGIISPREQTGTHTAAMNLCAPVFTWDDLSGFRAGPSEQEISNQAAALASGEVGANLRSMQKDLEPQLVNLCQSAGLPDYVKTMAGMLLEYVMGNFKVDDGGDAAISQTLVISLCWRAASLFKLWIDPVQLTALASKVLQYNCKADVVESVYCRLKILLVEFQEKADAMVAGQIPSIRFYNKLFKVPKQEVIILTESPPLEEDVIEIPVPMPGQCQCANETEMKPDDSKEDLLKAQLGLVEKVCTQREGALREKQQQEVSELGQFMEREKLRLTKEHRSQLERLPDGMEEKVDKLKEEFEGMMRAFNVHVWKERERLQALHMTARELERSIKERWVEKSKLGNLEDDFDNVPLSDSGEFIMQEFKWSPSTTPLIHGDNLGERSGVGDIASGSLIDTSSPPPQETGIVAEEVTPVVAVAQGDTAAEPASLHRDDENISIESPRNTMLEEESQAIAGSTRPAGTTSTLPVEPVGSIPSADIAESTTSESAESALPDEAAESTPYTETPVSTPHAEARELTPSLTEVRHPAVVDVVIANGETTVSTSDALSPLDVLSSIPRDVSPHPVPQQSVGVMPQNQSTVPVVFQNVGRQSAEVNLSNGVCNGHGTTTQNGTAVGLRPEVNYNALWQMLPLASPTVFPHGLHADPLRNELTRIKQQEDILARRYEARKMQLKMELEEEIEKIRRKYEEISQDEDNTFQQQKQHLDLVYKKVLLNQALAEEFRAKFIEHKAPSALASPSISSPLRSQVPGSRPQLPLQHRGPQRIQRAPAPAATAPWQGNGIANGSLNHPIINSSLPSAGALHIPSTSSPMRPSAASSGVSRAPFSSVTLTPRPAGALRSEQRAPAPHLARARPHMSATGPTLTPIRTPGIGGATTMEQLQSMLARSQESLHAARSQEATVARSQPQTQNLPVESLLASRSQEPAATRNQSQTWLPVEYLVASRSQEGAAAHSQSQTQNPPVESFLVSQSQDGTAAHNQSQTQNPPVESLLVSRSQEGAAAHSQSQTQNIAESLIPSQQESTAAPSETQTQNLPVQASVRGSGQVVVEDGVVCLSDDD